MRAMLLGAGTAAAVPPGVLATLDVLGALTGTPGGLLERVALFAGLGRIGAAGPRLRRYG